MRVFKGLTRSRPFIAPTKIEVAARTDELWTAFGGPLKRFIAKRVPDEQDAEDLLQEVFLRAHASVHDVRDPGRVRPWLYRVAANAVADYYRERRSADLPLMVDELTGDTPGPDNGNGEVARCLGP